MLKKDKEREKMKKPSKKVIILSALFSGAVLGGCAPSIGNFGGSFFSSQPSEEEENKPHIDGPQIPKPPPRRER